jgi:hypothetical protein
MAVATWGRLTIEVGPHTAVNPDHGSAILCYACGQSWFYANPPPGKCEVQAFADDVARKNYVFFRQAQVEHRLPWYDIRPEELTEKPEGAES